MKAIEWAARFAFDEQQVTEATWLYTPVDYSNRSVMRAALSALGPGWVGLAQEVHAVPPGVAPPENSMRAVLGDDQPGLARDLLHEGR